MMTMQKQTPCSAAPVGGRDLVVVGGVGKGERQHALLLQVGLMDARKGLDNDGHTAQVARLKRGVLAAGALAVVLVAHNHPGQPLLLVVAAVHA
jgi:hypothetical protein